MTLKNSILRPVLGAQPPAVNGGNGNLIDYGQTKPKSSPGSSSGSSGASDASVFQSYLSSLSGGYTPETLTYEAKSADAIRAEIAEWLRPGYDQAIANRKTLTARYHAELDADALSRGMGASTYVTDVKGRQNESEAADIATLESDYGVNLAKYVGTAEEAERERAFEVEKINSERRHEAYMAAYQAALSMFAAYKSRGSSGRTASAGTGVAATTRENCETFLAGLTPAERMDVYAGATPAGKRYRDELIASVGTSGYWELRTKYRTR